MRDDLRIELLLREASESDQPGVLRLLEVRQPPLELAEALALAIEQIVDQ